MKITLESADIQELEALEVELEEMVQAAKNLRYVPIGILGESDDKVKLASENVTMFMEVRRFRKRVFGFEPAAGGVSGRRGFDAAELRRLGGELVNTEEDE